MATQTKSKRVKTVFNNRELCHKWTSQSQDEGRGSNMFFHGKTIYSYGMHFPIASFVDEKLAKGLFKRLPRFHREAYDHSRDPLSVAISPPVVLFTNRSYSNTTAKHKNHVSRAINHCIVIYCKEANVAEFDKERISWVHADNIQDMLQTIKTLCKNERNATLRSYRDSIERELSNLRRYCCLFNLKTIKLDSENPSTQERAKRLTKELRRLLSLPIADPLNYARILGIDIGVAAGKIAAKRERLERQERKRNEEMRKAREQELERNRLLVPLAIKHWREGGDQYGSIPYPDGYPQQLRVGYSHTFSPSRVISSLPTMLRISRDGLRIETSRSATISVDTAKRIWPTLQAKGNPGDVEGYRGVGFNHSQEFVIGCHRIPYCELELIAKQLGLVDETSSECQSYDPMTCGLSQAQSGGSDNANL